MLVQCAFCHALHTFASGWRTGRYSPSYSPTHWLLKEMDTKTQKKLWSIILNKIKITFFMLEGDKFIGQKATVGIFNGGVFPNEKTFSLDPSNTLRLWPIFEPLLRFLHKFILLSNNLVCVQHLSFYPLLWYEKAKSS